jgi:hypothetical protein
MRKKAKINLRRARYCPHIHLLNACCVQQLRHFRCRAARGQHIIDQRYSPKRHSTPQSKSSRDIGLALSATQALLADSFTAALQ